MSPWDRRSHGQYKRAGVLVLRWARAHEATRGISLCRAVCTSCQLDVNSRRLHGAHWPCSTQRGHRLGFGHAQYMMLAGTGRGDPVPTREANVGHRRRVAHSGGMLASWLACSTRGKDYGRELALSAKTYEMWEQSKTRHVRMECRRHKNLSIGRVSWLRTLTQGSNRIVATSETRDE